MTEFELKSGKIKDLLEQHSVDALLLSQVDNFATAISGWPTMKVAWDGQTLERPAILEVL